MIADCDEVGDGSIAKLSFAEAAERINVYYRPYHKALAALVNETVERFGFCVLIDCHSMPSVGAPLDPDTLNAMFSG